MLEIIGATLTNATAIAVSPIPIIAVILMLMSPRSTRMGLAFLVGWFVGIVVATTVFTLLAGVIPAGGSGDSRPILGTIQIVLGLGLLLLGWRQWRSRPAPGETPELPAWMSKIDQMRALPAAGLAFALAAVNPKNLLVAAAAGTEIGHGGLDAGALIATILVFSVIAALSVLVPVLFALFAPQTAAKALAGIRAWLTVNNSVIMTVLLAILGANVIGKGLGAF
ncbi:GAP family protein [Leucobacter luti]|uniref:Sap-like sulfolipid-1-addressing protein n=1 Tax=Leucobacter luti TaxID=340320 RepID=A0A4Q7U3S7_9MICO|nr:GAP family protein [Leucobacter luti]MBL3700767.1 GAP family protein [Leucobacter luti]RZT68396.1 Sap-like sulfolipid-1-addressing protein [Leucobacter luti]